MPSIGSFGTKRAALDLDFVWCDAATIRVHPQASDIGFTEFMARAQDVELPDDLEAMSTSEMATVINSMAAVTAAIYRLMKDLIHPEDWDEFWRLAKENGQQNSDLMQLSRDIQAEVAKAQSGFPTGPPSDSSPTPLPTKPRSSASGPSRRDRRISARYGSPVRRKQIRAQAMEHLSGRPDLKVALLRSQPEDPADQSSADSLV
jgi:hypothetical protein